MSQQSSVSSLGNASVVDCYAHWAQFYDQTDNPLVCMTGLVLAHHAALFSGAHSLELACGTGRNLAQLQRWGATGVSGVDASPEMLAQAQTRLGRQAQLLAADMTQPLPGTWGPFDAVLVCLALEHVEHTTAVFETAATAALPGARLLVLELHPALRGQGIRARVDTERGRLFPPSFSHDEAELVHAAAAAGWTVRASRNWFADAQAEALSPKLAAFSGQAVVLDMLFERASYR